MSDNVSLGQIVIQETGTGKTGTDSKRLIVPANGTSNTYGKNSKRTADIVSELKDAGTFWSRYASIGRVFFGFLPEEFTGTDDIDVPVLVTVKDAVGTFGARFVGMETDSKTGKDFPVHRAVRSTVPASNLICPFCGGFHGIKFSGTAFMSGKIRAKSHHLTTVRKYQGSTQNDGVVLFFPASVTSPYLAQAVQIGDWRMANISQTCADHYLTGSVLAKRNHLRTFAYGLIPDSK